MRQPIIHNHSSFDRRHFITNTLKLAVAGNLLTLEQACKNKSAKPGTTDSDNAKSKPPVAKNKTVRHKWNREKLVMNARTQVVHLPTAATYMYYDEIKKMQNMDLLTWENQIQGKFRINKEQSGNIL